MTARGVTARVLDARQRFRVRSFDLVKAFLREKGVFGFDTFRRLADLERELAFSTALRFELDLMRAVSDLVTRIQTAGGDARDFRKELRPLLAAFGRRVADLPPHRIDLIFVQETTRAANAGLYSQLFSREGMELGEVWEFVAARETLLKDPAHSCSQMNGKFFRKDDRDAWTKLPQLHFRCRCRAVSRRLEPGMKVDEGRLVAVFGDEGFTHDKLTPLRSIFGPALGLPRAA